MLVSFQEFTKKNPIISYQPAESEMDTVISPTYNFKIGSIPGNRVSRDKGIDMLRGVDSEAL